MSFSQAEITGVNPPVQHGTELLLSWSSTAAVGTVFQVYLNQQLVWSGVGLKCSIPLPSTVSRIDIGTVGPGEGQVPFGSTLPAAPAVRSRSSGSVAPTRLPTWPASTSTASRRRAVGSISRQSSPRSPPTRLGSLPMGSATVVMGRGVTERRPAHTRGRRPLCRVGHGTGPSNRSTPLRTKGRLR